MLRATSSSLGNSFRIVAKRRLTASVAAKWDEERQHERMEKVGSQDPQASACVDVFTPGVEHAVRPYAGVNEKVLSVQTTLETAVSKAELHMAEGFREMNWTLHGVGASLVLLAILKNI